MRINIPDSLRKKLNAFSKKIVENPDLFTFPKGGNVISPDERDKNDPQLPGISDEFILNKDVNEIMFNGASLDRAIFSDLKSTVMPPFNITKTVIKMIESQYPEYEFSHISGNFLYPEGGFMGWHTNANEPGLRVYFVYANSKDSCFFRYLDQENREVVTDWDKKGWQARAFKISEHPTEYFWHCVNAEDKRISIGYCFKKR